MSQTLLYHGLGIKGWDMIGKEKVRPSGGLIFEIKPKDSEIVCPVCKSKEHIIKKGEVIREIQTVTLGHK
jgi:hypothetical protein